MIEILVAINPSRDPRTHTSEDTTTLCGVAGDISTWLVASQRDTMLKLLLHLVVPALLLSESVSSMGLPVSSGPSTESARLRGVQRAARDGMCTSMNEDAAIEALGGEFASTYGEITPVGFSKLGQSLGLQSSDVFCDAGSGLGRAVLQAAAEFGVRRAYGIEYAPSRHKLAVSRLEREVKPELAERVHLIQGDCADAAIWEEHLDGCTVLFASNLLFDDPLNNRLRSCIETCSTIRAVASLKLWPEGLLGFGEPQAVCCETSWSAPLVIHDLGGIQPHPGTPVYLYERFADGTCGEAAAATGSKV